MIQAQNVCKYYNVGPAKTVVLRDISLTVPQGSFTAVVGPSGSGKSTLLNLIAGLDTADSGRIQIVDTEISGKSPEFLAQFRLQHIGLVFQFFNLLPTLSLLSNVALAASLAGKSRREAQEAARHCLELVGLTSEINRLPHEVSGGEAQRAAIARALINSPEVILADEPTGSLDRTNGQHVFDIFLELSRQRKVTLVVATHDSAFERKADRVVRLLDGALVP
jgi:putative ABC transport system ATP-binding protein